MTVTAVLALSTSAQVLATYLVLRLGKEASQRIVWILVSAGMALLSARRALALASAISGEYPALWPELIGLVVSLCLLLAAATLASRSKEAPGGGASRRAGVLTQNRQPPSHQPAPKANGDSADADEHTPAGRRLETQYEVTRVLAEAGEAELATRRILQTVCENLGWAWGGLWTLDADRAMLRCVQTWYDADRGDLSEFDAVSLQRPLALEDTLPGRVLASRAPLWVENVQVHRDLPRIRPIGRAGLHGYMGFPIYLEGTPLGVMEFFSRDQCAGDRDLSGMLVTIGNQIGLFMERKRAETALAESEAMKTAILSSALDSIITIDCHGRVLEWNPAAESTFGFTREQAMGAEMAEMIIPEELRPAHRRGLQAILEGGGGTLLGRRLEMSARRRDGSMFPAELTIIRIPTPGLPIYTGYLRDITQRKQSEHDLETSEQRYRSFIQQSSEGIWRFELDEPVLAATLPEKQIEHLYKHAFLAECNDATARMYGYVSADEIVGIRLDEFLPQSDPHNVDYLQAFIRAGYLLHEAESRVLDREGNQRHILNNLVGIVENGQLMRAWGTQRDITDRKRAEQERITLLDGERAARAEAERASRMKDEFLATLSHELRTPLNAILGWAHLLKGGGLSTDDVEQGLETIDRNARVQTQIIEDLLDMSRIISGKVRLDVQRVELSNIVEAALETVRPAAEAKEIRIQSVLNSKAGTVSGDANRLQQIFWNLLSNAIKFTPKGGTVRVVVERVESYIEATVYDTGEGIAPEFLPHVFERFRQGDASTTRRHGGLGLGLAIVKQLVELHGGTVSAASGGECAGATFTVRLPLAVISSVAKRDQTATGTLSSALPSGKELPTLADVCVLVVDDEADARELVTRLLEESNAQVVVADCVKQALELLESARPTVLVSDIGMPEQDGYDLIRKVRALPAERGGKTPAVALTAFARSEDRRRALLSGYHMHMSKPVEPSELIAVVASLAGRILDKPPAAGPT